MNLFDEAIDRIGDVELISAESSSRSVVFESDLYKKIESTYSQGIGLRTIDKGQLGFSFSNDFEDVKVIDRAIESASFGEKAYIDFSGKSNSFPSVDKLKIYNPDVKDVPIEKMVALGEEIIEIIKEVNPEIKVDAHIEKEESHVSLKTSKGFSKSYKKSFFGISASGLLAKNDQLLGIHNSKIKLSPFLDVKDITKPIIEKFKLAEKTANINTGNYKVLFSPRAFKTLISILITSLNGKVVQKGISPLTKRLNEQIISKELTLIDDGTLIEGLSTAPFDGEGSITKRNILFDKGILKTFIFDLQTAGLLNNVSGSSYKNTGSASRSYSSMPSPGFRNLLLEAGKDSYESLLSSAEESILVDQFIGAGQSNVLAGEFSMNLELAFKIEKGNLIGRVRDVMMSGNVFDVLNRVIGIGDQLFVEGTGHFPYVLLDKLSIAVNN